MEAVSLKLNQTKTKHSEEIKDQSEDRGSSTAGFSLKLHSAWETLREIYNFSNSLYFSDKSTLGSPQPQRNIVRGTILRTHHVDTAAPFHVSFFQLEKTSSGDSYKGTTSTKVIFSVLVVFS